MTDQPGASQIISPPFPDTPEAASARRAELMANPEYAKSAANGDSVKLQELKELWRVENGMTRTEQVPQNFDDIRKGMSERDLEILAKQDDSFWRDVPKFPQREFEYNRGEATTSQKQEARNWIARKIAERGFLQKLQDKNAEVVAEWRQAHWVAYTAREVPDPEVRYG